MKLNNYPELLGKLFIINAPYIFTAMFCVIKAFLDENTINKVNILGSNYSEALLKEIDAENLPVEYGGSSSDGDGVNKGPWNDGSVKGYPNTFWEGMGGKSVVNNKPRSDSTSTL